MCSGVHKAALNKFKIMLGLEIEQFFNRAARRSYTSVLDGTDVLSTTGF